MSIAEKIFNELINSKYPSSDLFKYKKSMDQDWISGQTTYTFYDNSQIICSDDEVMLMY